MGTQVKQPSFQFKPFSKQQLRVLTWWTDASPVHKMDGIIADGSIRSGKTVCMSLSFVMWAMETFNGQTFAMCGKTIGSFRRNVLSPMRSMLPAMGYDMSERVTDNLVTIQHGGRVNRFYISGGTDESSAALIQGITLAGVLFDEVALMPESFVNQATGRCSVFGSKFWFNCNPGGPNHWFKKNWLDVCSTYVTQERMWEMQQNHIKPKELCYLHFCMDDNLSLSDDVKQRYLSMYSGVFFDRYIRGLWVSAEGVIYRQFAENKGRYLIDKIPDDIAFATIGFDFGGNGSAHAGICTGFSRGLKRAVVLDEYYRKEIISPTELERDVIQFIRCCQSKMRTSDIYFDSAEQVLIKGIRAAAAREHVPIHIHNARKSPILNRIRFTNQMLAQGRMSILEHCTHFIDALSTAVWDGKKQTDVRLDDGSCNIDSLDAFEYSTEMYISQMIKIGGDE